MSKKVSGNFKKVSNVKKGQPFIQITLELLCSPAWKAQSIHCRRLIDFLMAEHMRHGGKENERLLATYGQLEKHGIHRKYIFKAIREAERLGLILVEHGQRISYSKSYSNSFTLTFCVIRRPEENGNVYWIEPTNNWQKVKAKDSKAIPDKTQNSVFAVTNIHQTSGQMSTAFITHSNPQMPAALMH